MSKLPSTENTNAENRGSSSSDTLSFRPVVNQASATIQEIEELLNMARDSIAAPSKQEALSYPATPDRQLTMEDLGDIELEISIELGRAELLIEDVLNLRKGSVVSLDKLAGDPVDVVANGRLIARGELLVIDGNFSVRLSEVL